MDAVEKQKLEEAAKLKEEEANKKVQQTDHEMVIYMERVVELEKEVDAHRERVEQENYNLKIAEALAKIEREKNERLRLEAEERRKQMELELLRGKMDGRGKPKIGDVMKSIEKDIEEGVERGIEKDIEKVNIGGKLPEGLGKAPPPPQQT